MQKRVIALICAILIICLAPISISAEEVTVTDFSGFLEALETAPTDGTLHEIFVSGQLPPVSSLSGHKFSLKPGQNIKISRLGNRVASLNDLAGAATNGFIIEIVKGSELTLENIDIKSIAFDVKGALNMNAGVLFWGWQAPYQLRADHRAIINVEGGNFNLNGAYLFAIQPGGSYEGAGQSFNNAIPGIHISNGGIFEMNDGKIHRFKGGYLGGAILVDGDGSTFNLRGGQILDNTAESKNAEDPSIYQKTFGGAIAVINGATFNMYAGSISNNKSNGAGGGVAVRTRGQFNMYGGKIVNNSSLGSISEPTGWGGGIFADSYGVVNLVTGNIMNNMSIFYGGGIFIDNNAVLNTKDILVRNNTADHSLIKNKSNAKVAQGGGIWHCEYGNAIVEGASSLAIFDNTSSKDDLGAGDDICILKQDSASPPYQFNDENGVLGGGKVEWYADGHAYSYGTNHADSVRYNPSNPGSPITGIAEIVKNDSISLKAIVSGEDKEKAVSLAKVIVSGNSAALGGGIASNGDLRIAGNTPEPAPQPQPQPQPTEAAPPAPTEPTVVETSQGPYFIEIKAMPTERITEKILVTEATQTTQTSAAEISKTSETRQLYPTLPRTGEVAEVSHLIVLTLSIIALVLKKYMSKY